MRGSGRQKMRNAHRIKHSEETISEFWRLYSLGTPFKVIARQIDVPYWSLVEWQQLKSRVALNLKYREYWGIKGVA